MKITINSISTIVMPAIF